MARSKRIYIVQDDYDQVLAAFTVKHEMQSWMQNRSRDLTYVHMRLKVLRCPDGIGDGDGTFLTHEEVFGRE